MRLAIGALCVVTAAGLMSAAGRAVTAQQPAGPQKAPATVAAEKADEIQGELVLAPGRNKLLRTKADIYRTQVDDASVCDLVQYTPRSLSVVAKKAGVTKVTVWLKDASHQPVQLLVRVVAD